ncbi:MAG TPA: dihydrofolate reductase family protein [Candidatus Saccharimonadales bacterium]|nr:dihydrofolate reductase family protein [Candidatus Saccharimonadales bacterium]
MRKIVVLMMITLDGVIQSPSGPEEDASEDFKYGGWTVPYSDPAMGEVLDKEMSAPFDLLLGKKTYAIFARYWPKQTGTIADAFNKAKKYVVTDESADLTWKESVQINGDVAAKLKALKAEDGPPFQVWGSHTVIQIMLKNDLVDELRLRIFPVTIGSGKRLFAEGTTPAAFELTDSQALPSGVILANYKRAGELKTGTME